ncbi:MAG: sulfatase-like hydrolase/transferase [Phycisphaerales bacterium]|nr:sulfatase-like hydrolase/transferase [Phycisphaerales bacterium]
MLCIQAAAATVLGASIVGAAAGAPRPNVIVIVSDDLGYGELSITGNNQYITPNFERLAREGTTFDCMYVASAACSPSRAGFVAGVYPQRMGYERNIATNDGLTGETVTLFERFSAAGYRTGAIGKWHLGAVANVSRPIDQGVHEFFGFFHGTRPYWGGTSVFGQIMRRGNQNVELQWPTLGDPSLYDPHKGRYTTDAFGEEAVAFIDRSQVDPRPFFLYVAFNAPHEPLDAKEQDLALFPTLDGERRIRAAAVYALDRAVGWIVDSLDRLHIRDDTLVIFFNDNGGVNSSDNLPFDGKKGTVLEGGVRVPAIVRGPGAPAGHVFGHPASTLDLSATAIAAAGIQVPTTFDGADLRPYFADPGSGAPQSYIYLRFGTLWGIVQGDWKLVVHRDGQVPRLHYLPTDPLEAIDLTASNPALVEALRLEFTRWEATVLKPQWGQTGANDRNLFDHFTYAPHCASGVWSAPFAWRREHTDSAATLFTDDGYANAALEFPLGACSYTARNDMVRMSGLTYMLNDLRCTGAANGQVVARIEGLPLIFTNALDGRPPQIDMSVAGAAAAHDVRTPIRTLNDLQFSGDGTGSLIVNAAITEELPGLALRKQGQHHATIAGPVQVTGPLVVERGRLTIQSPGLVQTPSSVAIAAPGELVLGAGTTLATSGAAQADGLLRVVGAAASIGGALHVAPGARLHLEQGGQLALAGSLDVESALPANVRLIDGQVRMSPATGATLEAMCRDIGPNPAGFEPGEPGRFPIGELRILAGAPVALVDIRDNDGAGQAAREAVYAAALRVDPGATLLTGGLRVYCGTCDVQGQVDHPGAIVRITCLGDLNADHAIGFADLNILLGQYGAVGPGLTGDLDGDQAVTFSDLNLMLSLFSSACPERN